jgi:hypothetical protein
MSTGRSTFPAGPASAFFHVSVRKNPLRGAHAFNLNEADVLERFVKPWQRGGRVLLDGRAWDPVNCRLTLYEGPRLSTQQRSFGLGWSNAVKFGENVTHEMLTKRWMEDEPRPSAKAVRDRPLGHRLRPTLWGRLDRIPDRLALSADVITVITAVLAMGKFFSVW